MPTRATGRLPNYPVVQQDAQDEGPPSPIEPGRHSFVVVVNRDGEEAWIVDPVCLQPANDQATSFESQHFIVQNVTAPWPQEIAHTNSCSYLAVQAAGLFLGHTTKNWNDTPTSLTRQKP